jgi:tetratricopeptide (TPR) repeat protein
MFQKLVRAVCIASVVSMTGSVVITTPVTAAQAADKVSKEVGEPLNAALKAVQVNDWATAMASLKQAQAIANRTPYEDYVINKVLSLVAFNLKDYNTALTAVQAALASPSMPPEDKKDLLTNAFRLESRANSYPGIIQYGRQLEALAPMGEDELTNMAIAFYNTKDTASAQQYAEKAIAAAKAAGKQPPQAALEITMNSQAKANPEAAVQTLEQIVTQTNSPADWDRLIGVSFNAKGMNDVTAMDLYRLMLVTRAFNASEAKLAGRLANSLHYYGDAVAIMESAGATGPDLSTAKSSSAKEQGLIATEISAARKSGGTTALNVAEGLYGYGRYAEAEELGRLAGAKAGKNPGEAQMVVGMAQVRQGKFAEAAQTFQSVSGNAAMMRAAHLWGIFARQQSGGNAAAAAPAGTPPSH